MIECSDCDQVFTAVDYWCHACSGDAILDIDYWRGDSNNDAIPKADFLVAEDADG